MIGSIFMYAILVVLFFIIMFVVCRLACKAAIKDYIQEQTLKKDKIEYPEDIFE